MSGLEKSLKIEFPYSGEDSLQCAYRDIMSKEWFTADECLESQDGFIACCVDHMSVFALVTKDEEI